MSLKKSMYGINNYRNIFADELTNCLTYKAGFNQKKCKISVYYKYAPDGSKFVVVSFVDESVYWYTYEELRDWFVDKLGKIFHMIFIGYSHLVYVH